VELTRSCSRRPLPSTQYGGLLCGLGQLGGFAQQCASKTYLNLWSLLEVIQEPKSAYNLDQQGSGTLKVERLERKLVGPKSKLRVETVGVRYPVDLPDCEIVSSARQLAADRKVGMSVTTSYEDMDGLRLKSCCLTLSA
jgi:hypothetical protein